MMISLNYALCEGHRTLKIHAITYDGNLVTSLSDTLTELKLFFFSSKLKIKHGNHNWINIGTQLLRANFHFVKKYFHDFDRL